MQTITTASCKVPEFILATFKLVGIERGERKSNQCRRKSPNAISEETDHNGPGGRKWPHLHFYCTRPKNHTGYHACIGRKSLHLYAVWPSRDKAII